MSGAAILMMIVAIGLVWGGLVASILFLRARPEVVDGPWVHDPDGAGGPAAGDHPSSDAPLHRDL